MKYVRPKIFSFAKQILKNLFKDKDCVESCK